MGANNVEVQCEKHLSPWINIEMYFFFKLLIQLGISKPSTECIHLVKK